MLNKPHLIQTIVTLIIICLYTFTAALNVNNSFIIIVATLYIVSIYKHSFCVTKNYLLFILLLVMLSGFSFLFGTESALKYMEYCMFIGFFLACNFLCINYMALFKSAIALGLILTPLLYLRGLSLSINIGTSDMNSGTMMGLTYAILPLLLLCISSLFVKMERWWKIFAVIEIIILFAAIMLIGSRGIFVALSIYALFLVICLVKNKQSSRLRYILISGFVVVGISQYSYEILKWLTNATQSLGLEIYALNKMNAYYTLDNLDNGRLEIWDACVNGFFSSPIGHLVGSFEDTFKVHQHNLILQTMWEFGFIGILFLLIYFPRSFKILIDEEIPKPLFLVLLTIFCSSIVLLFYSSSFWLLPNFWLWTKIVFNYKKMKYDEESVVI